MNRGKFAALINCIDGRVQSPVSNWLKAYTGVDYTDRITEPGPDKVMAFGPKEKIEAIKQKVLVSINAHGSEIVAIAGHYDCAGNPTSRAEHIEQVKRAVHEIGAWNLNVRIIGLWVNSKWEAEVVKDTEHAHEHHKSHRKKHVHHGKSTRDLLNAKEVLAKTGIKRGMTFLDAGCGDGHFSVEAARRVGMKGKVLAVDAHEESLVELKKEIRKKNIKNVEIMRADITQKISVDDNSADVFFLANVMHGFAANDEIKPVLTEAVRVLKPDGRLIVVDFKKAADTPGPPLHVRLNPEDVMSIVKPYGFALNNVSDAGKYHYILLFVK